MTTILEQRRIEADFALNLMKTLIARFGQEDARNILRECVENAAREHGRQLAATEEREPDLETFADRLALWQAGGALDFDVLERSADKLDMNITRCQYAEMYKEMGAADIGDILSCGRDGVFCEGYHPRMKLKRTQTIMKGADHCDFRYRIEPEE